MPQEGYTPENTEKQLSQQEIEAEISEIDLRRVGLISKNGQLQYYLEGLLHSYGIAGEDLESFKSAKEALETRIENPTLSDKISEKFGVLFGKQKITEKADFLTERGSAEESIQYRTSGESLRESVGSVAGRKDILRNLMGEDLSFRGNTIEGEDKSARESSLQRISEKIQNVKNEVLLLDGEIAKKREEAYEAWKRENPDEWNKLQEQQKVAEETTRKIALFKEFLQTGPSFKEILQVLNSFDGELQRNRSTENYRVFSEARRHVYEKCFSKFSDGHLEQILDMPSDFYSTKDDIDFIRRSAKRGGGYHVPQVEDGYIDIHWLVQSNPYVGKITRNASFLVAAFHGYNEHYAPNESPVGKLASSLIKRASSREYGIINYDDLRKAFESPSQAYSESKNEMVGRESVISYFPETGAMLGEAEEFIRGFSQQDEKESSQFKTNYYTLKAEKIKNELAAEIVRKDEERVKREEEERRVAEENERREKLKRDLLN